MTNSCCETDSSIPSMSCAVVFWIPLARTRDSGCKRQAAAKRASKRGRAICLGEGRGPYLMPIISSASPYRRRSLRPLSLLHLPDMATAHAGTAGRSACWPPFSRHREALHYSCESCQRRPHIATAAGGSVALAGCGP